MSNTSRTFPPVPVRTPWVVVLGIAAAGMAVSCGGDDSASPAQDASCEMPQEAALFDSSSADSLTANDSSLDAVLDAGSDGEDGGDAPSPDAADAQALDAPAADAQTPDACAAADAGHAPIVQIAAGIGQACALLATGRVWCWGQDGRTLTGGPDSVPTEIPNLAGVRAITVSAHACALLSDGTVSCWGRNDLGQLGDGTQMDRAAPGVVPQLHGVIDVRAGGKHTCALLGDGTVSCWGVNAQGQLGDGAPVLSRAQPGAVPGLSGVVHLASGYGGTCAVLQSGDLWCWGFNDQGELGGRAARDQYVPVRVLGISHVVNVGMGGSHTCAVDSSGRVYCWGADGVSQLGDNYFAEQSLYPALLASPVSPAQLTVGATHNCAVTAGHDLLCWGDDNSGELGDGTLTPRGTPRPVGPLHGRVSMAAAGASFTCAVLVDGTPRCWGFNDAHQLGDGTDIDRYIPTRLAWCESQQNDNVPDASAIDAPAQDTGHDAPTDAMSDAGSDADASSDATAGMRDGPCVSTMRTLVGVDSVSVQYGSVGSVIANNDILPYRAANLPAADWDTTGWIKFDLSPIPKTAAVSAITLTLAVQQLNQGGRPKLQVLYSSGTSWSRASRPAPSPADLPRTLAVSAAVDSPPPPDALPLPPQSFPIDVASHDWSVDLARGLLSLGITSVGTAGYNVYVGTDPPDPGQPSVQPTLSITTCE
jgi:alpha-tubulin suppressor-like RCC1 family protein